MNFTRHHFEEFADKWMKGTITPEEKVIFENWYNSLGHSDLVTAEKWAKDPAGIKKRLYDNLRAHMHPESSGKRIIRFAKMAAAALVVLTAGAYLWNTQQKKPAASPTASVKNVLPGSDKAILTLSDGTRRELQNDRQVLLDHGVAIQKDSGRLVYGRTDIVAWNTMTTPRGGQYRVVLPDGSKVWLNAASSITYPTAFKEKERRVAATGEVYFEVAPDAARPFVVRLNKANIKVLGTHFNVNAYADEAVEKITLLEGKVDVNNTLLYPGDEARIGRTKNGAPEVKQVNVDEAIAWQRGMFVFDNSDLSLIARQLSRWYDVDVETAGNISKIKLGGGISKNVPLSETLKVLQASGASYKQADNKIILYVP